MALRPKALFLVVLATAFVLLLPFVAMQFTEEVKWGLADFAVAGVLLAGTDFMYELAASRTNKTETGYRVAVGVALATALILVWANLAVGLIGSEDNPANSMYVAVLAVGLVGSALARLEPRGMARALFATALAQALVPVIALIVWKPAVTSGVVKVLGVNAFFVALWAGSAVLFLRASAWLGKEPTVTVK